MVEIRMTQNDRGQLLRLISNYKEYKQQDYDNGKINVLEFEYDLETINHIEKIISGKQKVKDDYMQNSKVYREKTPTSKEDVHTPNAPLPFIKR